MNLDNVPVGDNAPNAINAIIEIPMDSEPVKYEVDKPTGAIFVDRVLTTSMRYPCNYGYVPHTLCDDGDPLDVLIVMPVPLIPGSVIRCRPLGVLDMTDENGRDTKLIAVPVDKVYPASAAYATVLDVHESTLGRIRHFFQHYKDLEEGKWVRLEDWRDADAARQEILDAIHAYEQFRKTGKTT